MRTLKDLLIDELRDIYSAELQLLENMTLFSRKAASPALREAIKNHLAETEEQVRRLEMISKQMGATLTGNYCLAMQGLIAETKRVVYMDDDGAVIDEALVNALQRIEHYEIAAYGNARTLAQRLGKGDLAEFLQSSLDEEKAADLNLTENSESEIIAPAGTESYEDQGHA